ncbi:MAG: hypothetical protein IJV70_06070 [Clostridia bacterium]|nr:hypothetical protein [Clostridia bacterium]
MNLQEFANYCFENFTQLSGMLPPGDTPKDPSGQSRMREFSFRNNGMILCLGTVTDTCQSENSYKVHTAQNGIRIARPLMTTGGMVSCSPGYGPGDLVLLACQTDMLDAVILGKYGERSRYNDADLRTWITQSENFQREEAFQKALYNLDPNSKLPRWTHGMPVQRHDAGEFYVGSPAGPRLFLDPFMAHLSLNDATGIWTFRDDSLLRIAGINYQKITAGSYEERLNDHGECLEYAGHCLNSWEALGYYRKPESSIIEQTDNWMDLNNDARSATEPVNRQAKPFHRVVELGGWLGQGKQSWILSPPDDSIIAEYGKKEPMQKALSRIAQHSDGSICIESAKGISITKCGILPAVQRIELTEDPLKGDTPDNYNFSHASMIPAGEPDFTAADTSKLMQSLLGIRDYVAYSRNYKLIAPLLFHRKDWYIPEVQEAGKNIPDWDLSSKIRELRTKQLIEHPETWSLHLEDREQKYTPAEAGLHLLPDGGVVLQDGYGSELRMSGGQITLSAPGGIWIRSGKDTQIWSGRDLNLRTRKHTDITTTKGSVRIKAEKNLELLGGNEGSRSGVVIESKGQGSLDFTKAGEQIETGGVVIKTAKGTLSMLANTVFARAGVEGQGGGMMLDAGRGRLFTQSTEKLDFIKMRHALNWGDFEAGRVEAVQESLKNQHTLPGQLLCNGSGIFQKQVDAGGGLYSGTHVYTKDAVTNIYVSPLKDKSAAAFDTRLRQAQTRIESENVQVQQGNRSGIVQSQFYEKGRPGYSEVLTGSGFSFRTDEELELPESFHIYVDNWQLICGSGTETWTETAVTTYSGKGEYPYPGRKYLKEKACLVTQDSNLTSKGLPKQRWSGNEPVAEYKDPRYNKPEIKNLDTWKVL